VGDFCKHSVFCVAFIHHSKLDHSSRLLLLLPLPLIIIMLPNQAIASTPSAPRPSERKEEGALLHYVCNYYAHPKLAQDTQQYS
jgi:hypothetical protein